MGQNADKHPGQALAWRWKRLRYLLTRVRGSMAQRGLRGTLARVAGELRRRPERDPGLDLLPLEREVVPFHLPVSDTPQVSVIIPMYGKPEYTLACLRSIAAHPPQATIEVIVVDDASPEDPTPVLSPAQGLQLLRQGENGGFVAACNAGAEAARGDALLFLNNDTQVMPDWLDALLDALRGEPRCGIVGSRLAYPDGRLQEAGGLVFRDGTAWNVGRFESRSDPRYRYRRDVDYVSGAALMIDRELFRSVGGFDSRFAPGYYEDVDLAFAVRAAGRRVIYAPDSLVVHFEGISAGTDLDSGMKRFQRAHHAVLQDKWAHALAVQCTPGQAVEPLLTRVAVGRILVIDSMTPDPARDSGSLRLVEICALLRAMGWHVLFAPDDGHADNAQIDRLGRLGVQVLCRPWERGPQHWLQRHGSELDAVMLCRCGVADQYASLVRRHAPRARLLFDTVDLHFLRERRAAALAGSESLARQAEASRRREMRLIETCDVTFVVSPHERELLAAEAPDAQVELLSNIHELHGRGAPAKGREGLLFLGGFGHPPNADAVGWLATEIMPLLRERRPDAVLHVLGDIPDEARRRLVGDGIELHGRVAELRPFMDRCRVSVAPLRFGAGVKGKVNMAMSYGLPVVATPIAAEGMWLSDGNDVLIAETAAAFVDAIERLLDDDALWVRLSEGGLRNVERHFSRQAAAATLERVLGAHARTAP